MKAISSLSRRYDIDRWSSRKRQEYANSIGVSATSIERGDAALMWRRVDNVDGANERQIEARSYKSQDVYSTLLLAHPIGTQYEGA